MNEIPRFDMPFLLEANIQILHEKVISKCKSLIMLKKISQMLTHSKNYQTQKKLSYYL